MVKSTTSNDNRVRPITLGFMAGSHLGDALCVTPLPGPLVTEKKREVYVIDDRSTRIAFANNPYIAGYTSARSMRLHRKLRGHGHLIQRLQRGFGLPIDNIPKPHIYLSDEEKKWAELQKQQWPPNKPVCILSTRVLTDNDDFNFREVDWLAVGSQWHKRCTVVQPVITKPKLYSDQISYLTPQECEQWHPEELLPEAIVYKDLDTRQYMALFSVADYFCGGTSGGAHIAAAFDKPALIVVWKSLAEMMRFPSASRMLNVRNFLYPQHQFITGEILLKNQVSNSWLQQLIDHTMSGAIDSRRIPCLH